MSDQQLLDFNGTAMSLETFLADIEAAGYMYEIGTEWDWHGETNGYILWVAHKSAKSGRTFTGNTLMTVANSGYKWVKEQEGE